MVEVFTDPDLSLDRILSFADSREIFRKFMMNEKSLGKSIIDKKHSKNYFGKISKII